MNKPNNPDVTKILHPPISHGSRIIADASFGTVCIVAVILLGVALYKEASMSMFVVLFVGILGAGTGYILWRKGFYKIATMLNVSGLLFAALSTYILTATIAGATGILFLASVITAGGLLGWKAAVIDIVLCVIFISIGGGLGDDIRQLFQLPLIGLPVDEFYYQVFILTSLPSWGMYVVAIDASNRKAWEKSYLTNLKLQQQQELLSRSKEQQEEVAKIGLLATGEDSFVAIADKCRDTFAHYMPHLLPLWNLEEIASGNYNRDILNSCTTEEKLFVRGLFQVLYTRHLREKMLQERAELASQLQKEQRLEALSRMAGGVAHDFNNSLAVIVSVAEEFMQYEEHKHNASTLLEVSRHTSEMTQQLLLFSQGIPLMVGVVDICMEIMQLETMLQKVVGSKGILNLVMKAQDLQVRIPSDHIQRIVLNLIRNAVEAFEKSGSVDIIVEKKGDMAQIIVSDNGKGMSSDILERAVEPYFSGKNSTGLGLSTIHGLVEQVGGTLDIQSALNQGTKVIIQMPIAYIASSPIALPEQQKKKERVVLLIDDERFVRTAIKMLLQKLGWSVLEAEDRESALQFVNANMQLLVCDMRLKGDSGVSLVQALQKKGVNVPVLYVTGYAGRDEQGPKNDNQLLVKPFRMSELERAIKALGFND